MTDPLCARRTGPSAAPSVTEDAELRQTNGPGLPAAPKAAPPETSAATLDPLLELSETKYRKLKPLNEGGSGFVHLCMDKYTGEQVAIKYLPRGPHLQGAERELLNLRACAINPHIVKYKEVGMLTLRSLSRCMAHPAALCMHSVVCCRDAWSRCPPCMHLTIWGPVLQAFLTDNHLAVVTEYADLGDLADYVELVRHKAIPGHGLPIPECRTIFQQLILALDFCHNRGIANRDLKMENLLLSSSADTPLGRSPSVKLCDFGCGPIHACAQHLPSRPSSELGGGGTVRLVSWQPCVLNPGRVQVQQRREGKQHVQDSVRDARVRPPVLDY